MVRTNCYPYLVISRMQFILEHVPHLTKLTASGYWESSGWKTESVIKKHTVAGKKERKKWWCLPHAQHWIVIFSDLSARAVLKSNESYNYCVANCQDHSGTAAAAIAQAGLLDSISASSPLRRQSHNFGPGQVEKELPVRNCLSRSASS